MEEISMALVVSNSGNALTPALGSINTVGVVALLTVALKALGALAAMPLHTPQSQDQTGPATRGW
ncbi:hypothetical protein EBZ35_04315, partial [bacterium]|nr:hypothetical protein [bacterium]